MDKLKQWVALTVVACLAIVAAGWLLVIQPKRSEAADLRVQAEDQHLANATLETQLQVLKAKAKDLPKEQAKLAKVAAKVPGDPALPGLVRALLAAATDSGVELVSLSPSEPQLAAATAVAPAPAPAASQQAQGGVPAAGQPGAAGQLAEIPLTVNVVGDFFELQRFLSELEELPRALLVGTLDITPGMSPAAGPGGQAAAQDGSSLTATIGAKAFMAASRPAPHAGTVPADSVAGAPVAATEEPTS
jgi:Tfp pilus assembly protein PilO